MKEKFMESSVVGVDLGHKSYVACRFSACDEHEFKSGTLSLANIKRFCKWLKPGDKVAIETGTASFWFKRVVERYSESHVLILEAAQLKLISKSLKKTDKEDSVKIARLVYSFPERDLPLVEAPEEKFEDIRKLCSERSQLIKLLVSTRARFYNLCIQAGHTKVTKRDFCSSKNMVLAKERLDSRWHQSADRLIEQQKLFETQLKAIEQESEEVLSSHADLANLYMSMPGIGPVTALALIAYVNGFEKFKGPAQVSCYAGLVPSIDQSGKTERYGHTIKRCNTYLRALMIQAAWSLIRSRNSGPIKDFFLRLSSRIGAKKAIVATARKMLEVLFAMAKKKMAYRAA